MSEFGKFGAIVLACVAGLLALGRAGVAEPRQSNSPALVAFHSDQELADFIKRAAKRRSRVLSEMPPPPPPAPGQAAVADMAAPVSKAAASPSITNNQEANVDEGDIVKQRGDILVVLRRGRLFTVSLARGGLHAVDSINAYPSGVDAGGDWYDEMLIAGDRIVVIGYSYSRGGTQINRFHLSSDGHLSYEDAYQLRSNDYYSSRNYASRMIGTKLIFYTPLYLSYSDSDPFESLPGLRRWTGDVHGKFERIASAHHVYIPAMLEDAQVDALHSVTTCDVAAAVLSCTATSVLGPDGRVFYVSEHAVYVWVTEYQWGPRDHPSVSMLYRIPLDGGAPSAIRVLGAPVDQFSFKEDGSVLDVLVRTESAGDAMWNGERSAGATALLQLPLRAFSDGTIDADLRAYRPLPSDNRYDFHNRFIGDYLLYGAGNGWGAPQEHPAYVTVVPVRGGAVSQLPLYHGVDRIEAMGRDAVIVGSDNSNTYFSAVELTQGAPRIGDEYTQAESAQAETRSHAFFFNPDADGGVLGLPIAQKATPAYAQLFQNSVAMVYLRRSNRRFVPLGKIAARTEGVADDACVASCVDWYGNARPIFIGPRAFALLGYEVVEGSIAERSIHEIRRISFAPGATRQ